MHRFTVQRCYLSELQGIRIETTRLNVADKTKSNTSGKLNLRRLCYNFSCLSLLPTFQFNKLSTPVTISTLTTSLNLS